MGINILYTKLKNKIAIQRRQNPSKFPTNITEKNNLKKKTHINKTDPKMMKTTILAVAKASHPSLAIRLGKLT